MLKGGEARAWFGEGVAPRNLAGVPAPDEVSRTPFVLPHRPTVQRFAPDEVVTLASAVLGVGVPEIASTRRSASLVSARDLLSLLAAERVGVGPTALARALGGNADCVSRWVTRAACGRLRGAHFATALDELEHALAEVAAPRAPARPLGPA